MLFDVIYNPIVLDLASSTQPDSSDSSDEEITRDPDTVPSDSSETSEDDMPGNTSIIHPINPRLSKIGLFIEHVTKKLFHQSTIQLLDKIVGPEMLG